DHCVLQDDATPILKEVAAADVVVYATPVYFGDASAQFKLVFDRHYAFVDANFTTRLKPGKKAVMILSQGQPEEKMFA
ncbi:MAG: NAD(P)H-dependent oxidoreductase, partial [Planctomycetota bacterium]|nr:NAD(P)H-dependent oxidoreductase [Planctomycetota bacterium]